MSALKFSPLSYQDTASFEHNGFIRFTSILSPDELSNLREACASTVALARAGKWPHLRTLPKQFPPWQPDPSGGIWGVQHLLHPDLPASATFTTSYFHPRILPPAAALMRCADGNVADNLVMELYNLLIRPDADFELRWHRDDIPPTATDEEEAVRLAGHAMHAQWNVALYPDSSLVVVPGSHRRPRTRAEREADPFDKDMPGQLVVRMEPGDVVFYDNNILHRGVYDASIERMTLHGSVGDVRGGVTRARNVLQHGVGEWVDRCDFSGLKGDGVAKLAEAMRKRLVELGSASGCVGYSQHD